MNPARDDWLKWVGLGWMILALKGHNHPDAKKLTQSSEIFQRETAEKWFRAGMVERTVPLRDGV